MSALTARTPHQTAYGLPIEVRPVARDDVERLASMIGRLSDRSRYQRFMGPKPSLSKAELRLMTAVDHRSSEALVAVDPGSGRIIGEARYAAWPHDAGAADLAFVVADEWQGQGVGTMLGALVVARAREHGVRRLTASTFATNAAARAVLRRLGFRTRSIGGGVVEMELEPAAVAAVA